MKRPSKLQTYMRVAECVAELSHDAETKVGAVLVSEQDGDIITTAYNGFIRGAPDNDLPNTRPNKYPYIIHAELNAISKCAMRGISMMNTILVCTHSPCANCMRMLLNCGIRKFIVKHHYKGFNDLLTAPDFGIVYSKTLEGYTEIIAWPKGQKS